MTIEMITEGLRELLLENNYNPATIRFYEREWNKIQSFLMLEDYSLHKVLTRRYYASKNPIRLNKHYHTVYQLYCACLDSSGLSTCTIAHYKSISTVFMDYLTQLKIYDTRSISMETCIGYLKTLARYSFKTVELNICGTCFPKVWLWKILRKKSICRCLILSLIMTIFADALSII